MCRHWMAVFAGPPKVGNDAATSSQSAARRFPRRRANEPLVFVGIDERGGLLVGPARRRDSPGSGGRDGDGGGRIDGGGDGGFIIGG